jgi:predicted HTH transcriptional regulator
VLNRKLEDVILKTVAAFANSQGGTLLIGVADDGEILGLEHDYQTLGGADRDKFELHLRNLLNQQFGAGFVTSRVSVIFHDVGDKKVCRLETSPVKHPVILTIKDKNGQSIETFYVRRGNSSQEISLGDMSDYLKERFHS